MKTETSKARHTVHTAHTPAPWHVENNHHPNDVTLIIHEQLGDPRLRMCVAQLDCSSERDANARLMASAPEMLEALQCLVTQLDGTVKEGETLYDYVENAKAAILKATN